MFAWLRCRRLAKKQRRLERLHLRLLEQARDLQRNGDIQAFAATTAAAAQVEQQIDLLAAAGAAPRQRRDARSLPSP